VPSSDFEGKTENALDYKLGRPHPEKPENRVLPEGGALIQKSERKRKTL
jgi:hypothetical protein